MPTEHTTVLLIQFLGLMGCSMCQHIHFCSTPCFYSLTESTSHLATREGESEGQDAASTSCRALTSRTPDFLGIRVARSSTLYRTASARW